MTRYDRGMKVLRLLSGTKPVDQQQVVDLINAGALLTVIEEDTQFTALHWACAKNCDRVVEALVKAGAKLNARTSDKRTPLIVAASHLRGTDADIKILTVLIENGASIKSRDDNNMTALNYAGRTHHFGATAVLQSGERLRAAFLAAAEDKKRESLTRLGMPIAEKVEGSDEKITTTRRPLPPL